MKAFFISRSTKSKEQVSKSVIAKCLNALYATVSYPLSMVAYYLCYGDHVISHDTAAHPLEPFTRAMQSSSQRNDGEEEEVRNMSC
jgi:hypothetical protein